MIIARPGTGWQTLMADLSMILFMITAAALSKTSLDAKTAKKVPKPANEADARPSQQADPMAIYVAAPDAPPLTQWLSEQPRDDRQQLTLTARYRPGGQAEALLQAGRLAAEAGKAGAAARIVIEPGEGPVSVALAYDSTQFASSNVARDLLRSGDSQNIKRNSP